MCFYIRIPNHDVSIKLYKYVYKCIPNFKYKYIYMPNGSATMYIYTCILNVYIYMYIYTLYIHVVTVNRFLSAVWKWFLPDYAAVSWKFELQSNGCVVKIVCIS